MSDIAAAIPLHIRGYDAAGAADDASPPSCVPSLKTGSDILVIRRVDTSDAVAQTAAVAGTPYLQASQCQYDAPTTPYKVDNTPVNFTLRQRNCTTGSTTPYAELRRMMVQIYYVDSENETGDGIPTLKRIELGASGTLMITPLVEGIEYMQVDYGLDSDSDGVADSYTTCSACTVTDWSNVMSAKISVIARNIETSAGYTDTKTYALGLDGTYTPAAGDHYKRHAYTQVVRLVNPAGRRETP